MDVVVYGVVSFAVDLIVLWVGKTMRGTSLKILASISADLKVGRYARRGSVFFNGYARRSSLALIRCSALVFLIDVVMLLLRMKKLGEVAQPCILTRC